MGVSAYPYDRGVGPASSHAQRVTGRACRRTPWPRHTAHPLDGRLRSDCRVGGGTSVTRSERLEAALIALVRERRDEIDALRTVRVIGIVLTFDDAGCVDQEQVRYESKRERRRTLKQPA